MRLIDHIGSKASDISKPCKNPPTSNLQVMCLMSGEESCAESRCVDQKRIYASSSFPTAGPGCLFNLMGEDNVTGQRNLD